MLLDVISISGISGPMDLIRVPLGWILNLIFELIRMITPSNVGIAALSIIVFTIFMKIVLIPMNFKQQKSQKLQNIVQPEIQKITNKYKGKKDNASMIKQQNEMQAVYDKYGTSPTGGCLQSLVTMIIVLALYRVVYNIYEYIPYINNLYTEVAEAIVDSGIKFEEILTKLQGAGVKYNGSKDIAEINKVLNSLTTEGWANLLKEFSESSKCVDVINKCRPEIIDIHSFIGGMNIKNLPVSKGNYWPGILIPVLALISQLFSINQITKKTMSNKEVKDNPAMQSMMMMNKIMPAFSFIACLSMPTGVGIYWILNSVLQIIQQFIFDKRLEKIDVDQLVKENIEKASKKKNKKSYLQKLMEAQGEIDAAAAQGKQNTLKDYAHISSRNYNDSNGNLDNSVSLDKKESKPGSISSYANIMKSSKSK